MVSSFTSLLFPERRILPEIEIKPGTPDTDLRQPENSLVPTPDEVKKVEELTTEVLPRRSREEKVLEIIESGEFIEKISPQVRRKFATPEGSGFFLFLAQY